MKLNFDPPTDGKMHRHCIKCQKEGALQVKENGKTAYHCPACGHTDPIAIYFNEHVVWLDESRELWHESAGVFVRNNNGKYLFFKRTEFPFVLTVPAGHVDRGEEPMQAAARELLEETALAGELKHLATEDVIGDSCSGASDAHRWSAFLLQLPDNPEGQQILDEGENALWLSPEEAQKQGAAFIVDYMINLCRDQLTKQ